MNVEVTVGGMRLHQLDRSGSMVYLSKDSGLPTAAVRFALGGLLFFKVYDADAADAIADLLHDAAAQRRVQEATPDGPR